MRGRGGTGSLADVAHPLARSWRRVGNQLPLRYAGPLFGLFQNRCTHSPFFLDCYSPRHHHCRSVKPGKEEISQNAILQVVYPVGRQPGRANRSSFRRQHQRHRRANNRIDCPGREEKQFPPGQQEHAKEWAAKWVCSRQSKCPKGRHCAKNVFIADRPHYIWAGQRGILLCFGVRSSYGVSSPAR